MTKSMKAVAEQGLKIQKITNNEMLESVLEEGLAALYRDVFAGPPYNEDFSLEEVKDIFRDYFRAEGKILLGRELDTDEIEAFVVATPLRAKFDVAAAAGLTQDIDQYFYIAEDGVSEAFRCRGISSRMKDLLLEECFAAGFEKGIIRTSDRNYKQISAINKAGGVLIRDVFQDVTRSVKGGAQEVDRSCLFEFRKARDNEATVVPRAVIVPQDGRDIAYVQNSGALLNCEYRSLIQANYPGIDEVCFISDFKKVGVSRAKVFDGRLYM